MSQYTFVVLGGDARMLYAAEMLFSFGFRVLSYGLSAIPKKGILVCETLREALKSADFILLPIPMSRDGETLSCEQTVTPIPISEIFENAPSHARMFGGKTEGFTDSRLEDYGVRSDFATLNAVPTAEGALLLAMQHLPCCVSGTHVAVTGFGKVGKAVAALFHAAGARVTVFARREEVCSVASLLGYSAAPLKELPKFASDFRCLLNTVPASVVGEDVLCRMKKNALVLELASAPYGIDFEAAEQMGIHAVLASGLPGNYSPEAAGNAISKTVLTMLYEKGILL